MIYTARIYNDRRPDAVHVCIMRYLRPELHPRTDIWIPDLGPSRALFSEVKARGLSDETWAWYRERFLEEMALPAAQAAMRRVRGIAERRDVVLQCGCVDESRCHRSLLRDILVPAREVEAS